MKHFILLVISCFLITAPIFAQQQAKDSGAAIITFEKDTIDYGTIEHDADGYRVFKFTNIGRAPLLIREVKSSCGCLVPSWPKEPIQPKQAGLIKAHYDTHRIGVFVKTLTVTSNATNSVHMLYIKGKVLPDTQK